MTVTHGITHGSETKNGEITLPAEFVELARELAALAKKYDLRNLSGHIGPGFGSRWRHDITFVWDSGRHGEDARKIMLSSKIDVHTAVPEDEPTSMEDE